MVEYNKTFGRIGARIHDVIKDDGSDLYSKLRDSELEVVQLTLPSFNPDRKGDFSKEYLTKIKSDFDRAGVKIRVISSYVNLLSKDIESEQARFRKFVDCAKILGVDTVGTETGSLVTDFSDYKINHTEESYDTMLKNFIPLVDYANDNGITVAVETVTYFPIHSADRLARLFSDLKGKKLCSIFDPTNVFFDGEYKREKQIVKEFVEKHAEKIKVVHLKDYKVEKGKEINIPLFDGVMDVEYLFNTLKANGVKADYIVEGARDIQNYKDVLSKLKKIMR